MRIKFYFKSREERDLAVVSIYKTDSGNIGNPFKLFKGKLDSVIINDNDDISMILVVNDICSLEKYSTIIKNALERGDIIYEILPENGVSKDQWEQKFLKCDFPQFIKKIKLDIKNPNKNVDYLLQIRFINEEIKCVTSIENIEFDEKRDMILIISKNKLLAFEMKNILYIERKTNQIQEK